MEIEPYKPLIHSSNMNLLNGPQNGLPKCLFLPLFKELCAQKHRRKLLENSRTCRVDENYP